ncbi:MAG: metal-dependent transcriptional regulator [Eubacteriales bacterium]|nr:metal-dependent transcriptional regulator [Eubacteriales bacterium]
MKIQKSAEDYLEAMLMLKEERGYIRSVDIAKKLGITKPSVSYAVKHLRENGYVNMNEDQFLELTESGMVIASKIYDRHKVLTDIFVKIGIDPETARKDACKVEHDLSDSTFDAIKKINSELKKPDDPAPENVAAEIERLTGTED